jgi:hypothetical protein
MESRRSIYAKSLSFAGNIWDTHGGFYASATKKAPRAQL